MLSSKSLFLPENKVPKVSICINVDPNNPTGSRLPDKLTNIESLLVYR